jgi:hypothetical protein
MLQNAAQCSKDTLRNTKKASPSSEQENQVLTLIVGVSLGSCEAVPGRSYSASAPYERHL